MKFSILLLTTIISTISCNQKTTLKETSRFDNFIFSYSQRHADYSMKFTNSDTIFLQKRFPRPIQTFYSIIQNSDRSNLDSFLSKINFRNHDTVYMESYLKDGNSYKFVLSKDTITTWTFIYGDEGPKQLYYFANWLRDLKENQNFTSIDTIISFGNLDYILLPKVQPPPKAVNSR